VTESRGHGSNRAGAWEGQMTVGVGGSDSATKLSAIRNGRDAVAPIGATDHATRVERAQAWMRELGLAALLLDGTPNLASLTGLKHGQSKRPVVGVLPARPPLTYLSPEFEMERIRAMLALPGEVRGWEEDEDPYALFAVILRESNAEGGTVALEDMARVFVAEGMRAALRYHRFVTSGAVTSHLRERKTKQEVAILRQAIGMTLEIQAAGTRPGARRHDDGGDGVPRRRASPRRLRRPTRLRHCAVRRADRLSGWRPLSADTEGGRRGSGECWRSAAGLCLRHHAQLRLRHADAAPAGDLGPLEPRAFARSTGIAGRRSSCW
jgi:hypothetical protein